MAPTAEQADEVIRAAKQTPMHIGFEGRLSTAGNLAFPFTPTDMPAGPVYEFSAYHLLEIEDPARCFRSRLKSSDDHPLVDPATRVPALCRSSFAVALEVFSRSLAM